MAGLTARFKAFNRAIGRGFRTLFSWRTLFVGFLAGSIFQQAIRHLVNYNRQMQQHRYSIATILNQMTDWRRSFGGVANHQERFNLSIGASEKILQGLRKMAASSVGTLEEYSQGFVLLSSSIMSAGGSAGDAYSMLRKLIPLAKASGVEASVAALDIRQILRGDANLRHINIPALQPVAKEAAKLARGGKQAEAMELIKKALDRSRVAVTEWENTFDAALETMQDNWKAFAGEVGRPIFNRINQEMREHNKNFATLHSRMMGLGELVGNKLVEYFDRAKSGAREFVAQLRKIAVTLGVIGQSYMGLQALTGAATLGGMFFGKGAIGRSASGSTISKRTELPKGYKFGSRPSGFPSAMLPFMAPSGARTRYDRVKTNVGAGRAAAGRAGLALIGLGLILSHLTGRVDELTQKGGAMGKMARQTSDVISGLTAAMRALIDSLVVAIGAVGALGKAIGTMFAKLVQAVRGRRDPLGGGSPIIPDKTKSKERFAAQQARQQKLGKNLKEMERTLVEEVGMSRPEAKAFISKQRALANRFERVNTTGQFATQDPGITYGKVTGRFGDPGSLMNKVTEETARANQTVLTSTLAQKSDALIASKTHQLVSRRHPGAAHAESEVKRLKKLNERALTNIDKGQERESRVQDRIEQAITKKIADMFVGEQKPFEINMPGATFNIQQDFRDEDPDRISLIFRESIGQMAATSVQSALQPAFTRR